VKALLARLMESRPWLAWKRYGDARGNVLAAGIGYFAFFSIFPAVALAFTVFGFLLRGRPELLASIADQLNAYLPGFVKDADHPKGLIPVAAPRAATLTIAGVIAFVTLVLAGLGWLGATREGIRAVFGAEGSPGNFITNKLRDLGVLFTLGLGIAISALLTSTVGAAAGWIAGRIGMSGQDWILTFVAFVVSVLADTGLLIVLLRVLSGVHLPWRAVAQGALVGGMGLSLLKVSAGTLLQRVTANPLFASIAIVVGLLFWLNMIARLTLISAAWVANDADELRGQGVAVSTKTTDLRVATAAARDGSLPTFGTPSADRTTLAVGAVLGGVAVVAAARLARGIRSVVSLAVRRKPS
jgi:membrane protein